MAESKTTKTEVPHVYQGIAAILNALSVEKGGQLPSNMGGKPYITAVDLSLEVKRQFVANSLVLLPRERFTKHEVIPSGTRNAVVIGVEGEYTIVSTVDGSSAVVSGVGDGLALGTAVASNIASTNALKNALLRTFLVTEQSVEDAAKNGLGESDSPAKAPAAPPKAAPVTLASLKKDLVEALKSAKLPTDQASIVAYGDKAVNGEEFPDEKGTIGPWHKSPDGVRKVIDSIG